MISSIRNKLNIDYYDLSLFGIILAYFGAKLYINEHIWGLDIGYIADLRPNTQLNMSYQSAYLPVVYLLSFLYNTLGLSSEFIKILIALFGITAITAAIYKISLLAFNNKSSALLAVILFLFSSLYFSVSANKPMEENNLTTLCYSFLIIGILYWLKNNYVISALFIGLSFDCHPVYPIALIVVFFVYLFARHKRISPGTVILSFIVFLVVTLPVTFGVVKSMLFAIKNSMSIMNDPDIVWKYIRFAQPENAFVDIKPQYHVGFSIYFASFLLLSIFYVQSEMEKKEIYIKIFVLMLTTILLGVFDNLNHYYFKIVPLFNLWLNRFTSYGSVLAYVVLSGVVTYAARHIKIDREIDRFFRISIFLILCLSVLSRQLWLIHFLLLEIVLIYYMYYFFSSRKKISGIFMVFNVILVALTLVYFYYLGIVYRNPLGMPFADLFSLKNAWLFFKVVVWRQFKEAYAVLREVMSIYRYYIILPAFVVLLVEHENVTRITKYLFNLISKAFVYLFGKITRNIPNKSVFIGAGLLLITLAGLNAKIKSADFKKTDIYLYERPMKIWVKNNTEENSVFLVPLYVDSWQNTQRQSLYNVNIINAASYNKAFMSSAIKNYQALTGIDLKNITEEEMNKISPLNSEWSKRNGILNEMYDNLPVERILSLGAEHGIKYFVTASKKSYPFPVVYENKKYRIYEIKAVPKR